MKELYGSKKIMLIMWEAGGAHISICKSLKSAAQERKAPWDVQIVHFIRDICPNLDPFSRYLKFSNEDMYNFLLRHDLFALVKFQLSVGRKVIQKQYNAGIEHVKEYMAIHKPDFVVSTVHHFNGIIADALHEMDIPFGVVTAEVLDLEDSPLWFAPAACRYAHFFALPTNEMVQQGVRLGCGSNAILSGGLVIKPDFYREGYSEITPQEARQALDLDKDLFTVMVSMGGSGGKGIWRIIREIEKGVQNKIQIIACCGKDERSKKKLDALVHRSRHALVPLGFTDQFPLLLKAADLLITKPGPTTIWEAIVAETPLIIDTQRVIIWEQPQVDFVDKYSLEYH